MENDVKNLNQKDLNVKLQDNIKVFIAQHKKEQSLLKSKAEIFRQMKDRNLTCNVSRATFYRVLNKLGITQISKNHFDYIQNDISTTLSDICTPCNYNNWILFKVKQEEYTSLIAGILNNYQIWGHNIHCVPFTNTVLCFYKNSKKDSVPLTRKDLIREIKNILSTQDFLDRF